MKSTLVEPPPNAEGLDEDTVEYVRADSVSELAKKTNIGDDEVLERVLLPGRKFGSYHIMGFVAAGGMGEIYAARRMMSDGTKSRPVALKVISAEYANDWRIIERFKREARISKAIRSRHVARVYEFGESPEGHAFMAMELLNGEELFDRLHRNTILSPITVAELTLQILRGLHAIHKSGFVHRDIKPENVFLATHPDQIEEHVKIIDFGVAKRSDEASDPLLSVAGQIYGTPQYIAPEQAIDPDVDHRADLYSLGVLMYECVTGELPFDGETSYEMIVSHQQDDVPRLPDSIDPVFADIIHKALAKTPNGRFQSAREMGRQIKKWVDENLGDAGAIPDELELKSLREKRHKSTHDKDQSSADEPAPRTDTYREAAGDHFSVPDDFAGAKDRSDENDDQRNDSPMPPTLHESGDVDEPDAPVDPTPAPQSGPEESAPAAADAADEPAESPDSSGVQPAPDSTELRDPRPDTNETDSTEARKAQIITGIALGLLIIAILSALLL